MQEIQNIVNAQVKQMAESGEIQKQVEEGVKSAISKAISKQFESWGNITKQLEKAFEENLKINNHRLNIPCLNDAMTEVVSANINEFYKGQAAEKLHALMKAKLAPLPDTMSLVEFVNLICKTWYTDDYDSFDEVDDYATVELLKSDHSWWKLKVWKQKEQGRFGTSDTDPDLHITISGDGKLSGRHGSTNPYYLFDVDALIFKAYAQGIILTGLSEFDSDGDDCDLQLKPGEY